MTLLEVKDLHVHYRTLKGRVRAVGQANIMECLRKLADETDLRHFNLVAFSAAGTRHGAWRNYYVEAVLNTGLADRVMVSEDYLVAHYVCFEEGSGDIRGTGSSAHGINRGGTEVKIGGWGHLIDDGGSAWHAGKEGIRAASSTWMVGDRIRHYWVS